MDQIDQIEHKTSMERKGENTDILFLTVAPNTIRVQSEQVGVSSSNITPPTSSEKQAFSPIPNTKATDFDF